MVLRKAETETLGSSVSKIRAKATAVGTDTDSQVKGASSEPSYEVITQQIAYLMSAVTNQNNPSMNKNGCPQGSSPMEMVRTHPLHSKDQGRIKEYDMLGMCRFRTLLERVLHPQTRE